MVLWTASTARLLRVAIAILALDTNQHVRGQRRIPGGRLSPRPSARKLTPHRRRHPPGLRCGPRSEMPPLKSIPKFKPLVRHHADGGQHREMPRKAKNRSHAFRHELRCPRHAGTRLRGFIMAAPQTGRLSRGVSSEATTTTNKRVSMIAVNIDVTIPIDNVTAKPRTGPEPKA